MLRIFYLLIGLAAAAGASLVHGQVTYTYTGNTFDTADPPYTTADSLSGSFTVLLPLAPDLVSQDLSQVLNGFTFFDGVQTLSLDNAEICAFEVTTNGSGQITDWQFSLRELPLPMAGDPQGFMDSGSFGELVGSGPAGAIPCASFAATVSASASTPGVWSVSGPAINTVTYDYQGAPFNSPPAPYTSGDRITGSLSLTGPVPAVNSLFSDLRPFVSDFSFSDGTQVRTSANSELCLTQLGTGGNGNIALWQVSVRELPVPAPGDPQRFIDISWQGDQAGEGPAGSEACSSFVPALLANNGISGNWGNDPVEGTIAFYSYRGLPYTTVVAPYTAGDRTNAVISIQGALPPNLPLTDVSLLLESMSYFDGVQQRSLNDSFVCRFEVGTNSEGAIIDWQISLRGPFPGTGQPQLFLDSTPTLDQAGELPAGNSGCDSGVPSLISLNDGGGRWIGQGPRSVPTQSVFGLMLLVLMLMMAGVLRIKTFVN